jgi:oligoribonuclease
MTSKHKHNLVWIDLEMTGLSPETDVILEIATIVTDANLNILAEGPATAITQDEIQLAKMNDWVRTQHTKSGLIERVKHASISLAQAEQETLAFVNSWVEPNTSPLCGNTICMDRRFLYQYMPALEKFFHYRNIDVSTLKELAYRWKPDIIPGFSKHGKHLALDDIRESIAELLYYRQHFIQS